jgi:uncharacterized protein
MMTPEPLTETDFDRLSDLLELFGDKRSMNLEQIDGFLAAVISGPEEIPESEYLRAIWGDDIVNEDTFAAQPLLREFVSLLKRHRDFILQTLQSDEVFTPLMLEDEQGEFRGNDWAKGFMRGMELRREDWAQLLDDDEYGGSLVPILALAYEDHPDPEMRPYKEPMTAERREKLIVGVATGVMRIFDYFESQRLLPALEMRHSDTFRRTSPKVGRNDPCPCGSGKKFKQCCGKITLH